MEEFQDGAEAGLISLGQVDRVRGLAGEVVVTVYADDPARMARLASVFVRCPEGAFRAVGIQGFKRLGARAVLKLDGYDDREAARGLVGQELFIPREASTPAPKGRYYAYELEGLAVRLTDGTPLGTVREVLRQGGQSLLVIAGSGSEVLVPLVKAICVEIDKANRVMTIDPPEGLIDLNARRGRGATG